MDTKVLVVDDEEAIRGLVEHFLALKGISVLTVGGGDECLMCLEKGFRGVILMDVMMPEMSGWDTIRAIVERDLFEGNVIVMLTAQNEPDKTMVGVQEYVTDYLTKPFNPDELMTVIEQCFELLEPCGAEHA